MMNILTYNLTFCLIVFYLITNASALEKEMTVTVDAGKEICFYQNAKPGYVIDVEYQVIDGSHGELDINFQLVEPKGRILFADFKKSENNHRTEVTVEGDYKFCWDNTFSTFNTKTIFFEIIIEGDEDEQDDWNDLLGGLTTNEYYDLQLQDIQDAIAKVRQHLIKVRHLQDSIRSHEARDRNVAEENYFKVNAWSMTQIVLMIVVGFIQVVMVKSLFDDNSKIQRLFKRLK